LDTFNRLLGRFQDDIRPMNAVARTSALHLAYFAGRDSALVVRHPAPGVVRIDGRDCLDFLHRMSTNAVLGLPEGRAVPTVLTTPLARVVDLVWVLSLHDHALMITGPDRGPAVHDWLKRHIFFQDDVRLSSPSAPGTLVGFYGPASLAAAQAAFPTLPPLAEGEVAGGQSQLGWSVSRPSLPGIRVLVGPGGDDLSDLKAMDDAEQSAYTALRIEAGAPEHGAEIDADAIPLEVGLQDAISFTKGCYIGQEIIARMETRHRRARVLCGLQVEVAEHVGAALRQEGAAVGRLTSVAFSPRLGWIGLAVARPSAIGDYSGHVQVGEGTTAGQLVELPMS
jgi:folate-binding protein YgfZ